MRIVVLSLLAFALSFSVAMAEPPAILSDLVQSNQEVSYISEKDMNETTAMGTLHEFKSNWLGGAVNNVNSWSTPSRTQKSIYGTGTAYAYLGNYTTTAPLALDMYKDPTTGLAHPNYPATSGIAQGKMQAKWGYVPAAWVRPQ